MLELGRWQIFRKFKGLFRFTHIINTIEDNRISTFRLECSALAVTRPKEAIGTHFRKMLKICLDFFYHFPNIAAYGQPQSFTPLDDLICTFAKINFSSLKKHPELKIYYLFSLSNRIHILNGS